MMNYKSVYLDTVTIIYLIENKTLLGDKARSKFLDFLNNGYSFFVSSLVYVEFLTKPYSENKFEARLILDEFFKLFDIKVVDVNKDISDLAAKLRSKYKILKSMDAIHLATSKFEECEKFFTNDKQLKSIIEIDIEMIE